MENRYNVKVDETIRLCLENLINNDLELIGGHVIEEANYFFNRNDDLGHGMVNIWNLIKALKGQKMSQEEARKVELTV
jgi:hypothetical protein